MRIFSKHSGYSRDGIRLYCIPGLFGSNNSGTAAPDPALVAAQIKSMGYQDDLYQQIVDNTNAMQPKQLEQMQFGLDSAKTAYQQAQEDRQWNLGKRDKLDAAQQPLLDEAKNFDEGARRDELMAQSTADIEKAFGGAQDAQTRQLSRMGVNPSSGKALAMGNQMALSKALAEAGAGSAATQAAKGEKHTLQSNAANMLAGYPAAASGLSGSGANFGGLGLTYANNGLAGMNSGLTQAGGVAGQLGSNATGMWGQQASSYNAGLQADASASAGMGSAIGGIAMAI